VRIIQQYVNKNTGQRYYYAKQPVFCDGCETQLHDFVVVRPCWDKKRSFIKQLCSSCSEKHKQITQADEKLVMCIVNKKPKGTELVLIRPLELRTSTKDDSLFCNTIDTPHVNNKAKRSGRPEYTVLDDNAPVMIGQSINEDEEVKKDKLLKSVDELDALLLGFKNEQILIGDDEEKKLLE
jgi:hypothetical protein